jgi:restriction endonuclease S subunit
MDLKINVPTLETQKKIVELYNLRSRERRLIAEIQEKKDLFINQILINSLNN